MNKFIRKSQLFIKRNAPTILTYVGSAGVIGTAALAVKATPKALKLIEQAKEEKGEELTKFETVNVAAPVYIPAAITGVATITCIFGANALNKRKQAALVSAYVLLDNSYKEYKKKVEELYGEEADLHVTREIAKDHYEEDDIQVDDGKLLFYDDFSSRYFESTMADVIQAEYEINKRLNEDNEANVNDFYEMLGLPAKAYDDEVGWSLELGSAWYGYSWIDFEHEKVVMEDDLECYIIIMKTKPHAGYYFY